MGISHDQFMRHMERAFIRAATAARLYSATDILAGDVPPPPLRQFTVRYKALKGGSLGPGRDSNKMLDGLLKPTNRRHVRRIADGWEADAQGGPDIAWRGRRYDRVGLFEKTFTQTVTEKQSRFMRALNQRLGFPAPRSAFAPGSKITHPGREILGWHNDQLLILANEAQEKILRGFGFR